MKLIFKNLFSLGFVQGINLLIPLLVTPFLILTIGVSSFGVVSTAQGIVYLFTIFTDFGFSITAVRRLAKAKNHPQEIRDIVNEVFFSKLLLLAVSFVVFIAIILAVNQFNRFFFLYLSSFTMVIGQSLLPIWFFQGVENIKKTVLPLVVFRLAGIVLIFVFIKTVSDAYLVNFFFGLGTILSSIALYFIMARDYGITLKPVHKTQIRNQLKDSFAIFVSNLGVVIYGNTSLVILSFFLTPATLGVYSIVDKIIQLLKSLLAIIHQVSYPRICYIMEEKKEPVAVFIKKFYGMIWVGVLMLSLLLFFQPTLIVSYFVKEETPLAFASNILKQLSFVIFITSLNMPFFQMLLAYKKDWLTVRILLGGSILSIILNLILVPQFKIQGTIITIYIVEAMVTSLLIYFMVYLKKAYEK